jgi:hypothetical protein
MKIQIDDPNVVPYQRSYPCLLKHIGNMGDGNPQWKNTIVLALTETTGVVLRPGSERGGAVDYQVLTSEKFTAAFWVDYFGVVTFDNRLPSANPESTERRLDPQL